MKKAAFIGTDKIRDVYPAHLIDRLAGELDFPVPEILNLSNLDSYRREAAEVEYLFSTWGMIALTEEQIRTYFPKVRALFYAAGTVQAFARPFLNCGIAVFSAWAANAVPVAEYTFAQIVLANKGFFRRMHHAHEGGSAWAGRQTVGEYTGNYETKVGIIGAGMIGKMVIERLKSLDFVDVLVFDPFLPDDKAAALGVTKVSLETLFAECSVISNHQANNAQTQGMLNGSLFERMGKYATFINTGRGAQVVEADLIAALKAEPTRTALLDVTYPEPPRAESELYTLPNVVLTPHIAGSLYNEIHRMAQYMYEEYRSYDAGEKTRFSVTMEMLATMA